ALHPAAAAGVVRAGAVVRAAMGLLQRIRSVGGRLGGVPGPRDRFRAGRAARPAVARAATTRSVRVRLGTHYPRAAPTAWGGGASRPQCSGCFVGSAVVGSGRGLRIVTAASAPASTQSPAEI